MIQANEIKVNNLLLFKDKEIVKVNSIYLASDENHDVNGYYIGNYKGVELTEDVLLNKTPFQKINYSHYAYLSFLIWRVENRFYYDKNGTELKYVHDLQNSFYYNTNKVELTINL